MFLATFVLISLVKRLRVKTLSIVTFFNMQVNANNVSWNLFRKILDRLFSAHSFNTCEDMVEVDAESAHTLPPSSRSTGKGSGSISHFGYIVDIFW